MTHPISIHVQAVECGHMEVSVRAGRRENSLDKGQTKFCPIWLARLRQEQLCLREECTRPGQWRSSVFNLVCHKWIFSYFCIPDFTMSGVRIGLVAYYSPPYKAWDSCCFKSVGWLLYSEHIAPPDRPPGQPAPYKVMSLDGGISTFLKDCGSSTTSTQCAGQTAESAQRQ